MQATANQREIARVNPVPGFTVTETRYDPGARQGRHDHGETRLIVTVRGEFLEEWGRLRHSCGPASALLRPAGELHSNHYGAAGAVCAGVRFGAEWMSILGASAIRGGCDGSAEMGLLARRLLRELNAPGSPQGIGVQCGVLEIVTRFRAVRSPARERRAPHWIESTKELLRSRLNSPPDLLEAGRLAGVHPAHLSRSFRQFAGMTMGDYLRRERIDFACRRLLQPERSLAGIALEAGFYDQAHFSRVFRQRLGVSPKEYRLLHRRGSNTSFPEDCGG